MVIKVGAFADDVGDRKLHLKTADIQRMEGLVSEAIVQEPNLQVIFQYGDCVGGNVESALDFSTRILGAEIDTVGEGYGGLQSSALIAFLGCRKRVGDPKSRYLIHPISLYFENILIGGVDKQMAINANRIKLDYVMLIDFIESRTNLRRAKLIELFGDPDPDWFDAPQALEAGIIHEIME
jgi:ATP-dependent protease ClpP protease subunit